MMYNEILDFLHVFDGDAPEDESQAATESNIDPFKATVDRIIQLENSVVSNQQNLNDLVDILSIAKSGNAAIQVGALKLLMQAVSHEGENASQSTGSYEFPNSLYLNILELVLDSTEASDQLLRSLADSYLNLYDDLRYYFFRDVAKIASPDYDPFKTGGRSGARTKSLVEETESFVSNTFAVMGMVRVVPTAKEYTAFWVNS
ncbi:Maturation and nuclear export of 40S ribosomal subunits interacting protein, partial [Coemansia sp. RSA 25]